MRLSLCFCLVIYFIGVCGEDISNNIGKESNVNQDVIDCMAESKVDIKTLTDVVKINVIPNTPEMQCYLACMMKKAEMMNADGTFSKRFLEEEGSKDCRNLGGKDTCEIAYKAIDCFRKSHPLEGSHNSE